MMWFSKLDSHVNCNVGVDISDGEGGGERNHGDLMWGWKKSGDTYTRFTKNTKRNNISDHFIKLCYYFCKPPLPHHVQYQRYILSTQHPDHYIEVNNVYLIVLNFTLYFQQSSILLDLLQQLITDNSIILHSIHTQSTSRNVQLLLLFKGIEHVPNIFMSFDKYFFLEVINILI